MFIAYEYQYKLLTQILFENLREVRTTCQPFDFIDYENSEVVLG